MRIAIVTGASSGIGREFVKQLPYFYRSLEEIWVIARRRERLETLANMSPVPLRIFEGDLTEGHVYSKLGNALETEKPNLRMLVNAAGFGKIGQVSKLAETAPSSQMEMVDLNCRALTRMTLTCLPYLSKGSRVIHMASAAAFLPQPSFAVYAATKAYVLSFSRGLGAELEDRGIFVTAVCPGPVDTEFFEISGSIKASWKTRVMAKPEKVVKQALLDSRNKKAVSIYGIAIKTAQVGAKLLPHRLVMKTFNVESSSKKERHHYAENHNRRKRGGPEIRQDAGEVSE